MEKKEKYKIHILSKKKLLLLVITILCIISIAANYSKQAQSNPVAVSIEKAHKQIWSKFMDKENGILYDYVGSDDTISIPTPEECEKSMPNALSWWVPNENGAFFNGIYLDALCNRWKIQKDNMSASEARKVAAGLVRLASVGKTPGFVARGVSTDGVSHFPASSVDQTYPWFYGLWRYVQSGIPNNAERKSIIIMMEQVALALEEYNWKIPCERNDLKYWGGFSGIGFKACTSLLSVLRFMYELTGNEKWINSYYSKLNEKPSHSLKTRLEILTGGIAYKPPNAYNSFWTYSMAQAALKELFRLEKNKEIRLKFRNGLNANAEKASEHISCFREFDNDNNLTFNPDWRILNKLWKPQKSMNEAVELAELQLKMWNKVSPKKPYELIRMMEPLNACWIVVLSGNTDIINSVKDDIRSALTHYNWSQMSYSTFFMAECVYYEGIKYGL